MAKILDVVVVVDNFALAAVVATSWACHNCPSNGVAYESPVVVVGLVVLDNYNNNSTFAVVLVAVVDIAFACTCLKNRL